MRDADGLYAGPIVDPHHHLWDRSLGRHPWLKGASDSVLTRDCLAADYLHDSAGHNVVATVHIEAGWDASDPFGEIAWLDALEKPEWMAARYVAYATLDAVDAAGVLDRHAANSRVVGVRDILSWHPDPGRSFSADRHRMNATGWRRGMAHVDRLGFTFDLMISPWQMAEALELARAFPGVQFVLNHCGSPFERSEEGLEHWASGLATLATAPNVSIKISDLVAYDPNWTVDSLRRVVLTCIDAFGPSRAMLASDHPVVKLGATFDQTYGAFKTILADFSDAELVALFVGNAAELYHLPKNLFEELL